MNRVVILPGFFCGSAILHSAQVEVPFIDGEVRHNMFREFLGHQGTMHVRGPVHTTAYM
jgi:hypothetical protein